MQAISKGSKERAAEISVRASSAFVAGEREKARLLFLEATALDPSRSDLLVNLGVIHLERRDVDGALAYFKQAQAVNPDDVRILKTIGFALRAQNNWAEAKIYLDAYLTQDKTDTDAKSYVLECMLHLNQSDAGLAFAQKCLDDHPDDFRFYVFKVSFLIPIFKYADALEVAEAGVKRFPDNMELHVLHAQCLFYTRDFVRTKAKCLQVTRDFPENLMGWSLLGLTQAELWDVDGVKAAFDAALAVKPDNHDICVNYATALMNVRLYKEAEAVLRRGLMYRPVDPNLHYNLTSICSYQGHYRDSLTEYGWMWQTDIVSVVIARALKIWHGEDLNDRSILIFTDQGVGDTIQFVRFLDVLRDKYPRARVTLALDEKIIKLFRTNYPEFAIMDRSMLNFGMVGEKPEYTIGFCSMPLPLGIRTAADIAALKPNVRPTQTRDYRDHSGQLVVGLAWSTNSAKYTYKRTLPLMGYRPLADIPNVKFIDLQYGDTSAERAAAAQQGMHVLHDDTVDSWNDLDAFAAQVKACDLVISIDNSTVHYAGTLGVPCWTLLPDVPFFRWEDTGEATPWYPNMRLFRSAPQAPIADLIPIVAGELRKLAAGDTSVLTPAPYVPREPDYPPFICVLGDSINHGDWGHQASSDGLHRLLSKDGRAVKYFSQLECEKTILDPLTLADFDDDMGYSWIRHKNPTLFLALEECAEVIVDSASNLHGTDNSALVLLYMAYVAKTRFKKKVRFINGDCFPEETNALTDPVVVAFYRKVLLACDAVQVRDGMSANLLRQLEIPCSVGDDSMKFSVDAFVFARDSMPSIQPNLVLILPTDESGPDQVAFFKQYLKSLTQNGFTPAVLTGATCNPIAAHRHFEAMIEMVAKEAGVDLPFLRPRDLNGWFETLASAACVVSGRYHGALAAHLLGVPVLALPADTPRMDALMTKLQLDAPLQWIEASKALARTVKAQRKTAERSRALPV